MRPATVAMPQPLPRIPRTCPRTQLGIALTLPALLVMTLSTQSLQAQYPASRYVQTNPNYVQYSQAQQSAYPPQEPYAQQPGYSQQPSYQTQQDGDQAYADQSDTGNGQYAPPQQAFDTQQSTAQPFAAEQLEQLVAPIALYPDTLVAQILAAATYPAQVAAADNWLRAQGPASPDQIAYAAGAQTNWDPSVKALTAFPQVLAMMDRDLRWTTDLGNAYYNQPQDVLQTVQVMRQRAQSAGNLQNTPQEQVSYNQGYIQLAPPNPQVVYVPTYNPWGVYGQPVSPYPGFTFGAALGAVGSFLGTGLRFGAGIGLAAFNNTPFGWAGWVLNWLTSSVFFHQSPYYSHSTSVAHWGGGYGGGYRSPVGGINRRPAGFDRPQQGLSRLGDRSGVQGFNRSPSRMPETYAYNRSPARPDISARPALPVRPEAYGPTRDYGSSYYANQHQPYAARPAVPHFSPQAGRAPAYAYQRNEFAQRSYAEPRSYSSGHSNEQAYRSFEPSGQQFGGQRFSEQRSSGFHMFGGGHGGESYHASYHAPKAPKAPKMSGGGHHSGGGHSGHHGR